MSNIPEEHRGIEGEGGPDAIVETYWYGTARWWWPPSWFSGYYRRRYK